MLQIASRLRMSVFYLGMCTSAFCTGAETQDALPENALQNNSPQGLFLFLSENEQRELEISGESSIAEETPSDLDPGAGQTPENVIDDSKTIHEPKVATMTPEQHDPMARARGRYNGAVLMGSDVLAIWIDGRRFSKGQFIQHLEIESVERSGAIRLTSSQETLQLMPGDALPIHFGQYPGESLLHSGSNIKLQKEEGSL